MDKDELEVYWWLADKILPQMNWNFWVTPKLIGKLERMDKQWRADTMWVIEKIAFGKFDDWGEDVARFTVRK